MHRSRKPDPRVVITVHGGAVQHIASDVPLTITVFDIDNLESDPSEYAISPASADEIGRRRVDAVLRACESTLATERAKQARRDTP